MVKVSLHSNKTVTKDKKGGERRRKEKRADLEEMREPALTVPGMDSVWYKELKGSL